MAKKLQSSNRKNRESAAASAQHAEAGPTPEQQAPSVAPAVALQRASAPPPNEPRASELLALQRTAGNRAVLNLLSARDQRASGRPAVFPVQTKLTVGPVGDIYEQEADKVARQVMGQINLPASPPPASNPSAPNGEDETVRKKADPASSHASAAVPSHPGSQPAPSSSITPAASVSPLAQRLAGPEGGEVTQDLEQSIQDSRGGGQRLADSVRQPMEHAFKADFSGVSVHTDARSDTLNRSLQARAFTAGQDMFFKEGEYNPASSAGRQLIAHELTHVVQQQPVLSRQYEAAHSEVAGQPAAEVVQPAPFLQRAPITIQRTYAALGTMAKARVDQQSEEKYAAKAQEFEFKMAPIIMGDARVNAVVDVLVARVRQIVDAWAEATGREKGAAYEREFGWRGGDEYYAAFEMTGANIKQVFEDKTQPMRAKLKLVYNAVRNNNLAKWLKLAAIELDRQAKGKTPRDWKIKSSTQSVTTREGNKTKIVKGRSEKETVKAGFAAKSGLKDWLKPKQVTDIAGTAEKEKLTEHKRSKRDVFGQDRQSGVMGWKAETFKANKERTGGASNALRLSEQRTLTVGDVANLTDAEIDQMYIQKGQPKPDPAERLRFRSDPGTKLGWSQGGEYYDINLGSDSAKEAATLKARLEAGISGSTDLMLHAMENLGLSDADSMKGMRLALAGWMLANRDHSFYEIYKAAESYGVPFDKDTADPGKEYESDLNLAPMAKADFADTLPEKVYPRHYLSTAYKDTLAGTLPEAAKDQDTLKASLRAQGVSDTLLVKLDPRGTAELSRLSEVVARANLDPGQKPALRFQAVRRIKLHNSFIYLGNTLGIADAGAMLSALFKTHHGGKGLMPDTGSTLNTLADAGIPRMILDMLPPKEINQLELARQAAVNLRKDPKTGQVDMKALDTALNKTKLDATRRALIRAVLVQTYHGNGFLTENEQLQANALRTMVSQKEAGAKKLSGEQLDALKAPTPKGGAQIKDEDYWASGTAAGKLPTNIGIVADSFLKKMKDPDKARIRQALYLQMGNNDPEYIKSFKEVEKDEGFAVAVTSFANAAFIETVVLPPNAGEALTGLRGLHPKELGAIFQYTTALYKPIVNVSNSFSTEDFGTGDLAKKQWGSPLGTLKYAGPMLQALSSGLAKLPVYPGSVYRLETTRSPYLTQSDKERQKVANTYKKGSMQTQNYPMSTMKTLGSQFASTNYGNATFSMVYEIINVKTGHDIQYVSDQVKEEEVLFEPGSRLRVIDAFPNNPNDPADKHVWIRFEES